MKSFLLALAGSFAFAPVALAALPPAPTITVAATDIKQLQFDISPVTRANWYELWFKANPGAPWVEFTRTPVQRPRIRINTPVHLLDWRQARYFVKACNPSGCSQSNEVGVDGEQLAAIGFFKPATRGGNLYFGFNFAVSADGKAMVVVAGETIDRKEHSAAIHVYRKTSATSAWRLEARLVTSTNQAGSGVPTSGDALSISADGNLIAFGSWIEGNVSGGIYNGAVYLFRRAADGWHETQKITGDHSPRDFFGINVKLDAAGKTLVIGHDQVGGVHREGTLEVYQDPDDGSDQFVYSTTVPTPAFEDPQWGFCRTFSLSEVGHIARSCFTGTPYKYFTQVLTATAWQPLQYAESARLPVGTGADVSIDSEGKRLLIQFADDTRSSGVFMYRRETSGWVKDGTLAPFPGGSYHMAMSGDGRIVAIGGPNDTLAGRGPLFPPYLHGEMSGSVAIYERRASGWALRRYVKNDRSGTYSFGWEVALDRNGNLLAVGSPYDPSRATGIDGDREDASAPNRGAVWLY